MMGWNTFGGYGLMGGFFGFFFMILFWGLIILGVVSFVQWISKQGTEEKKSPAMTILEERYAKGEINKEEFETKKKDLIS
jgi:putative membrane protein